VANFARAFSNLICDVASRRSRLDGYGTTRRHPRDKYAEELRGDPISRATQQGLAQSKKTKVCQEWSAGEAQMRVNPEGDELDLAVDEHS